MNKRIVNISSSSLDSYQYLKFVCNLKIKTLELYRHINADNKIVISYNRKT